MNKTADRIAAVAFLAVGSLFMAESLRLSKSAYGSAVGPNVFPFLLGLVLALLSIKLLFETRGYKDYKDSVGEKPPRQYKKFLIIFIAAVFYATLLETVGYVITTFLFLVIGFQTMERGALWKSIAIAAGFSLGVYGLYVKLLQGTLPSWPIWFQ
ncbi:tripartite tricarboxylate transporter TctB family protein [Geobacillus sp. G4]|uniref:Transporter n=3 Tax=Geobacillus TaxID=129337 RepID=A0A7U9P6N1_GEOTM|nr:MULTISPECIES: tripartite tricarboxylate transporter TctB family protein [Geobacillus]AMV11112.1 transporter [Geobacillus thermoleovorans]AOL34753.1 transporter [Geobacillus thermoleovorans]AWO75832.1 tripartite tricarboxylate transporter TctB family protein [Geobacillus thermoleovorans]ESU72688.1 transporter [Geobacillus sp. MAS1]KDE48397.1 transporter [Geobacillus sp. CAMR5420]